MKRREDDEQAEGEAAADENGKSRVADQRPAPNRTIYCLDLRVRNDAAPFIAEIRRIAAECSVETVGLLGWINGTPRPEQLERYLDPAVTRPSQTQGVPPGMTDRERATRGWPRAGRGIGCRAAGIR